MGLSLSIHVVDVPSRILGKSGIESCDCSRVNCGYNDRAIT